MLQNREDIIRIEGQLKLINQKLDNHIHHISGKVDTIFRTFLEGILALISGGSLKIWMQEELNTQIEEA